MIRTIAEGKVTEQPETVMAMLQARLGRLDSGPRRAVRAAAVLGQTFWRGGVAAILDLPAASPEVEHGLSQLMEAELIVQHASSRLPGEPEYSFRHALVCDAACSLLLPADLQLGHKRAGRYLRAAGEADLRAIAEHFERGGLLDEAAAAYAQAAAHTMKRADFMGTLAIAECALRCGAAGDTLGQVRGLQAEAYFLTPERARLGEVAHEAVRLLPPGSVLWYKALWRLITTETARGNASTVDPWAQLLVNSAPQEGASDAYVEALGVAISVLCTACRFELARTLLGRSRELHRSFPRGASQPGLLVAESQYLRTAEPDPFRQLECLLTASSYFHRINHTEMIAIMDDFVGEAYGELGDFARGETTLRGSLRRAERAGQGYLIIHAKLHLAALLIYAADSRHLAEAEELVRSVLTDDKLSPTYREWSHGLLAQARQQQGDPLQAEAEAQRSLALPATAPLRRLLVTSTLIGSLLAQQRFTEVRERVQQTLSTLEQLGSGGYAEARIRLTAAEALAALGDPQAAARQLQTAGREIRLRADKIPEPEMRARYLTKVPENARILSLLSEAASAAAVQG